MTRHGYRTPPRSGLRIADLKARQPHASRLMNVRLPGDLIENIARLAEHLGANKTETVVMLLNEGLARCRPRRS